MDEDGLCLSTELPTYSVTTGQELSTAVLLGVDTNRSIRRDLHIRYNQPMNGGGRFGRGVSLYRYRSQLFVRFVGTIPTADRAVFSDLILGL